MLPSDPMLNLSSNLQVSVARPARFLLTDIVSPPDSVAQILRQFEPVLGTPPLSWRHLPIAPRPMAVVAPCLACTLNVLDLFSDGCGGAPFEEALLRPHTRLAFQASNFKACFGQRSLLGAGDVVQLLQIGASQVPLFFLSTFQSQTRVADRPQAQRWRRAGPQTIADPPPGTLTLRQIMPGTRCARCRRASYRRPPCRPS